MNFLDLELNKCKESFPYFCGNYLKVNNFSYPHDLTTLKLWPHQEELFREIENNSLLVVNKCRVGGFTTLMEAYALWMFIFKFNCFIGFTCVKNKLAHYLIQDINKLIDFLPSWLQPVSIHSGTYTLVNRAKGSKITILESPVSLEDGLHYLFMDEAAFTKNAKDYWEALKSSRLGGLTKCYIFSTPKKNESWFSGLCKKARDKKNSLKYLEYNCSVRPDFSLERCASMKKICGEEIFQREMMCSLDDQSAKMPLPEGGLKSKIDFHSYDLDDQENVSAEQKPGSEKIEKNIKEETNCHEAETVKNEKKHYIFKCEIDPSLFGCVEWEYSDPNNQAKVILQSRLLAFLIKNMPPEMVLEFKKDCLCINGVPTKVVWEHVIKVYDALVEMDAGEEESLEMVGTIIHNKLKVLF